jgi:hypothetical protein
MLDVDADRAAGEAAAALAAQHDAHLTLASTKMELAMLQANTADQVCR